MGLVHIWRWEASRALKNPMERSRPPTRDDILCWGGGAPCGAVPVAGKVVPEVKEAADLGKPLGAKTARREIED